MIDGPLNQGDLNLIVADFQRDETWNWEAASFTLRKAIKDKIRAIPIRSCGERRGTIMWKYFKDGEFTAKLAYLLARQEGNSGDSFQGTWIWKLEILPKITHLLRDSDLARALWRKLEPALSLLSSFTENLGLVEG